MSRASTPFTLAGRDAYLPSIEHEDRCCESLHSSGYPISFNDDNTPNFSLGFGDDEFENFGAGTDDKGNPSSGSNARDWTTILEDGHSLDTEAPHRVHVYPFSEELPTRPQPYPIQRHIHDSLYQKPGERIPLHRALTNSNTNTPYHPGRHQGSSQAHTTAHRRSWSQNDIENLPNLPNLALQQQQYPLGVRHQPPHAHPLSQTTTNPTFVRLCESRHRPSPTSKGHLDKNKAPQKQHLSERRANVNPPTSAPAAMHSTPRVPAQEQLLAAGNLQLTGPKLVHMSKTEQRQKSPKIIEVGAMAVLNMLPTRSKNMDADARSLQRGDEANGKDESIAKSPEPLFGKEQLQENMLRSLLQMEKILKEGAGGEEEEKALKGCEMIREVLSRIDDRGGGRREESSRHEQSAGVDEMMHVSGPASSDEDSGLVDEDFMARWVRGSSEISEA